MYLRVQPFAQNEVFQVPFALWSRVLKLAPAGQSLSNEKLVRNTIGVDLETSSAKRINHDLA